MELSDTRMTSMINLAYHVSDLDPDIIYPSTRRLVDYYTNVKPGLSIQDLLRSALLDYSPDGVLE